MKRFTLLLVLMTLLSAYTATAQIPETRSAITLDNTVSVTQLTALEAQKGVVNSVLFSPDSSLLAYGGEDTIVRLWDVSKGQQSQELKDLSSPVNSLAFSTDGTVLAAGGDMLHTPMVAWNTQTGRSMALFDVCASLNKAECDYVRSFFSDDKPGRINAIVYMTNDLPQGSGTPFFGFGEAGANLFWFVDNNAGQWQSTPDYDITSVVYSHDQSFRISGRSDGLGGWTMTGSKDNKDKIVSPNPVSSLALFADSSLAAGSVDGKIHLWTVSVQGGQVTAIDSGFLKIR